MNEKYLWDKSGEDAEIELLEQKLQVFRQKSPKAPFLPKTEFREKRNFFNIFFKPTVAFAGCLLIVFLAVSIYWNFSFQINNQTAFNVGKEEIREEKRESQKGEKPFLEETQPIIKTFEKDEVIKPKKRIEKANQILPTKIEKAVLRSEKPSFSGKSFKRKNEPKLTTEEKYAYQQLMIALSITGKQLKIVKDKVSGSEMPKDVKKESNNIK